MGLIDDLKKIAEDKSKQCTIQSNAYSLTLCTLTPANLLFVIGGALLSMVAGASILVESEVITKMGAGVMALVSGGFAIIHSKLGCDQYQAECKKLVSVYKGIAEDYSNLSSATDVDDLRKKTDMLNSELSNTIKNSTAFPFTWAFNCANKHLDHDNKKA